MKRTLILTASILFVLILADRSLACGNDCSTCASCCDASRTPASCSAMLGTAVASTAAGARWCVRNCGRALCACQRLAREGITQIRTAVSYATDLMQDALGHFSAEVTSISLRTLHSAFSSFLALVWGLTHS